MSKKLDKLIFKVPHEIFEYACPACVYKLKGEEALQHSMLLCMDGNESLKRLRRVKKLDGDNATGQKLEVIERYDGRTRGATYFLEESEVNDFAFEVKARTKRQAASQTQRSVTTVSTVKCLIQLLFLSSSLRTVVPMRKALLLMVLPTQLHVLTAGRTCQRMRRRPCGDHSKKQVSSQPHVGMVS